MHSQQLARWVYNAAPGLLESSAPGICLTNSLPTEPGGLRLLCLSNHECGRQEVLLRGTPPGVVLLELHSQRLDSHGFPGGALALLQQLHSLGYTDISHSGCAPSQHTYLCRLEQ